MVLLIVLLIIVLIIVIYILIKKNKADITAIYIVKNQKEPIQLFGKLYNISMKIDGKSIKPRYSYIR